MTALVFLLSSCASIVSKSHWPVAIGSTPTGAGVAIFNRDGKEIYSGKTPTSLTLKGANGFFRREAYKIKFSLDGAVVKEYDLHVSVNGWYWGNIIFGGLIGMLILDPATGAMYRVDQDVISQNLTASGRNDARELKVYGINEVPENLKSHLVRID